MISIRRSKAAILCLVTTALWVHSAGTNADEVQVLNPRFVAARDANNALQKSQAGRDIKSAMGTRWAALDAEQKRLWQKAGEVDRLTVANQPIPWLDSYNASISAWEQNLDRFAEDARAAIARAKPYRDSANAYQDKRRFATTLFKDKENFPARCAVVLSAALNLRPDPAKKEKSLADIDADEIDPAFRGNEQLTRYYVQAQQLADRLARDWKKTERYNDWQTARAKVGSRKGVIFFRDADWRKRDALRPWEGSTGDHIDVWDGAKTGSGYTFRKAREIWFWELPR